MVTSSSSRSARPRSRALEYCCLLVDGHARMDPPYDPRSCNHTAALMVFGYAVCGMHASECSFSELLPPWKSVYRNRLQTPQRYFVTSRCSQFKSPCTKTIIIWHKHACHGRQLHLRMVLGASTHSHCAHPMLPTALTPLVSGVSIRLCLITENNTRVAACRAHIIASAVRRALILRLCTRHKIDLS